MTQTPVSYYNKKKVSKCSTDPSIKYQDTVQRRCVLIRTSKYDTALRGSASTRSCDLQQWIIYSKVADSLWYLFSDANDSWSSSFLCCWSLSWIKQLLCLFLVTPSQWFPSLQTPSWLPVTVLRALIYDCFALIILQPCAAAPQLSTDMQNPWKLL